MKKLCLCSDGDLPSKKKNLAYNQGNTAGTLVKIWITFYNFRYYLVLPWFVFYFKDIPSLNSTSVMGMRVSSKAMPYLMGLQVILGSASNTIMAVCCIVSKFENNIHIENYFLIFNSYSFFLI